MSEARAIAPLTNDGAAVIATILDEDALAEHISGLDEEHALELALRLQKVIGLVYRARQLTHVRLGDLGTSNALVVDPLDGTLYRFTRGRSRRVKDVAGLVEQAHADGLSLLDLIPFLASGAIKVSEDIEGSDLLKQRVQDWAVWVDDKSLEMIELDRHTMKPRRR